MSPDPVDDLSEAMVDAAERLTSAGNDQGVTLRPIGGVGVLMHCPVARRSGPHRRFGDLDMAANGSNSRTLSQVFEDQGFEADRRFNALQGDRRMIFHGSIGKIDVFIGTFAMCHRIELGSRLELESDTVPASDLLLTKLQVVELNEKDAVDIELLLSEHELGQGPGDHIDIDYVGAVAGDDWGLWRTCMGTLRHVAELRPAVAARALDLVDALDAAPKTRRFRMRARIGERVRWYELPDAIE